MRDDRAEGSVVGVILIIGIGIALAAGIFFMANRLLSDNEVGKEKPVFGTTIDANDASVTVVQAAEDLDWVRDLRLGGTCTPTLNGATFPTTEGTLVMANDVLQCEHGETLTVSSSEAKGNALLFRHTFA